MSTKGGHKSSSSRTEIKTLTNSNGAKPSAPAPINAWARPLQPKRTTAPPPGIDLTKSSTASPSSSSSASPPSSSLSSSSSSSVLVHRERLLHLSLTIVGQSVIVHQTNGAIIEGIFHTFTPFSSLPIDQRNKYVLKEIIVRRQATNGADLIKNGVTLIVPASKVSCLHAKDVATNLTNNDNNSTINKNNMNGGMSGSSSMLTSLGAVAALSQSQGTGSDGGDTFVTDTQISSSSRGGKNQDLVAAGNAWTAGGSSSNSNSNSNSIGNSSYKNQAIGNSSGGSGGPPFQATNSRAAALAGNSKSSPGGGSAVAMSGSIGQWDQFKANKELFNVDATFDENIYTTQLDTSQLDAKKVAEAERIANEIKTMTTSNIHVAEERGFKVETDFDEEDLYSGVLTTNGKQRHEESVPKKTKETEKSSSVSNQQGPNIDSLKQNISATSTAPTKIMNYAAAAAKADTSSSNNKTAPPGFLGNNHDGESSSSAPTTTITISVTDDNGDKEENNKAESQTVAVMPEKKTKVDVKSTQVNKSTKKAESNSSKDDTTKNDIKGKTAGKNIRSEKAVPSTNDNNKLSKDEASISALSTRNEKVKKSGDSEKDKGKEKKKEKKDDSKLNANAKSFTFNPSAKSFTPSLGGGGGANNSSAPQQPPQHASTTDSSMQMYGGVHPMQPPHYMQTGPIGQPGMVPMINPQYQGMRYPPASYGIEQTMPQMQHQPPHAQAAPSVPSDPSSGNAPTPTPGSGLSIGNEDDSARTSRDGNDTSQKQGGGQQQPPQRSQQQQLDQPQGPPHQQQTQQQQIPIPYNVPPGAYFTAGGIPGMPPRGPGYAQFVTGPQQIAGRPGAPPYGIYPMQPGGMPPNMQMRGPNGVPFYPGPNGPIPYPPGAHMGFPMMDDGGGADFRNRGARSSSSSSSSNNGRGRGRTRSNSGRGRSNNNNNSNYNNNNNHNSSGTSSGKNTQQQYNNYQPPQQQQQHQPPQQQGQSATHAHSSKSNNPSPSNKADDRE